MVNLSTDNVVKNVYTSVACNRKSGTFDWGYNGFVVFAACNAIAILDTHYNKVSSKIIKTFVGHTDLVNTVKWIRNENDFENEFISGSNDCLCLIWKLSELNILRKYELKGHQSGVAVVDAFYYRGKTLAVTASNDSLVKIWEKDTNQDEYICIQTIELNHLCLALKGCMLSTDSSLLLVMATDDNSIRLFVKNVDQKSSEFLQVQRLLGHEDWVRSVDISQKDGEILLASSSQDTFIRLWKIQEIQRSESHFDSNLLRIEEKTFGIMSKDGKECRYKVVLESVLSGHDGWVTGVQWNKTINGTTPLLLSSSIDKSLIIWAQTDIGTWMEKVKVGDVGGNSLGFLGGKIAANGLSILGLGFQGSFQLWHQSKQNDSFWIPGVVIGGHSNEVRDLSWEPKGTFLLTVSADQTTRLHAPWIRVDLPETWHELARPQVHGYDMQAVTMLSRYKFASCAEEKIVRTFQAPGNFVENLESISLVKDEEGQSIIESNAKGASVPSLGLSNKSVSCPNDKSNAYGDEESLNYFVPINLKEPPAEATLMQNTLWPEIQKLYGHGYDVYALCSTPDGKLLASSCKATTAEDAYIILWDTKTWKQIQKLFSHQLTVTQMRFSPNNKYLLTVSRDRRWTLFENMLENGYDFQRISSTDKKNGIHSRIIWTCDWSHDSTWFATASRDGKVVAWHKTDQKSESTLNWYSSMDVLELGNDSITALAISPISTKDDQYLVALGGQTGIIFLYGFKSRWNHLYTIQQDFAHHKTVKRLAFRPAIEKQELASCGEDHILRIYSINL